jgi:biopolymer transport protein ExbB
MRKLCCKLLYSMLLLWRCGPLAAADFDAVSASLVRDIQTAQNALAATEADVGRQRAQLARELNAVQNRVLQLREQAVAARRLADEETLSLAQIETRLDAWREQGRFQSGLLAGYLEVLGLRTPASDNSMAADLATLQGVLEAQGGRLDPAWTTAQLALTDGRLVNAELLQLGPLRWYWLPAAGGTEAAGGLAGTVDGLQRQQLAFSGAALQQLQRLRETGSGALRFDPTLSRAIQLAGTGESWLEHLRRGGRWVVPIVAFGLFATLVALAKGLWLQRLPPLLPALAERAASARQQGATAVTALRSQVRGMQLELLDIALGPDAPAQREDKLYATLLEQRVVLERWLGAIALTASVAPLLGLLGTVSGMITTFRLMTLFGAGDASAVSSGISEALITTELGLVVAIPALLAHALMSRRIRNRLTQLEADAVRLSQLPGGAVA